MSHPQPHPLAGQTVHIDIDGIGAGDYTIENWWDNISSGSWMFAEGNPAALKYAMRIGLRGGIPVDNEVVYGKLDGFGHIVHVSELPDHQVIVNGHGTAIRADVNR